MMRVNELRAAISLADFWPRCRVLNVATNLKEILRHFLHRSETALPIVICADRGEHPERPVRRAKAVGVDYKDRNPSD